MGKKNEQRLLRQQARTIDRALRFHEREARAERRAQEASSERIDHLREVCLASVLAQIPVILDWIRAPLVEHGKAAEDYPPPPPNPEPGFTTYPDD